MREFDVTPQDQGSECKYQNGCKFYLYGIYCNHCTQYDEFEDIYED